ncbi:MAG: bifunctional methionine sulfoxide reductase B/A protein [Deltaproteobacteria bacterium]|nr:bifunctional methionine sulfoxide reductase B/A protein [Deltaproteobacteria bacterium]
MRGKAASNNDDADSPPTAKKYRELTREEAHVILDKGTERAFSGKYWNNHEDGIYRCRQCGVQLFSSDAKFDSRTGWPSFDDALPGAVKRIKDADGMRTEIVCANCGGHLGHVFYGEGFTPKNARYCVNSISLDFEAGNPSGGTEDAKTDAASAYETAYFAGGCFWGVEYYFDKEPGVISAESGFMGGHVDHVSYRKVTTGRTGHAETVKIVFDPAKTSYERLARLFFEIHDPTQVNRQGPDRGTQYRSAVFYTSDEQHATAEKLIDLLQAKGFKVATEVSKAGEFWKAEDYHQDYYEHKGSKPYCHFRTKRFD